MKDALLSAIHHIIYNNVRCNDFSDNRYNVLAGNPPLFVI